VLRDAPLLIVMLDVKRVAGPTAATPHQVLPALSEVTRLSP
jgi:hypothetical protein